MQLRKEFLTSMRGSWQYNAQQSFVNIKTIAEEHEEEN